MLRRLADVCPPREIQLLLMEALDSARPGHEASWLNVLLPALAITCSRLLARGGRQVQTWQHTTAIAPIVWVSMSWCRCRQGRLSRLYLACFPVIVRLSAATPPAANATVAVEEEVGMLGAFMRGPLPVRAAVVVLTFVRELASLQPAGIGAAPLLQ